MSALQMSLDGLDPALAPHAAAPSGGWSRLHQRGAQALEQGRARLLVTAALFALGFLAVAGRMAEVAILNRGAEPALAQAASAQMPQTGRADIVDRNGVLLATTLTTASLYADPALILDPEEAADRLLSVLPHLDRHALLEKLTSDRRFVWLERNITPRQQYEINRLGIPGIAFQREERRVYPHGALAVHAVGFTGVDNNGLAGIEQTFDALLRQSGEPLRLSLDLRLQHILRRELQAAVAEFRAIGGAGLILDVHTGEVLALVSLPDFDPHRPPGPDDEALFNRVTLGVYEMGSTFKIFNTALALESGKIQLHDAFDATRPIRVGRYTISDFHPENRWLSVAEIFQHSSNIGSVRMALEVGTEAQRDFLARLGLLRPSPVELPEVGTPMAPAKWREINTMTIAFGHGIAVSPIQLASAVAATINGGILHPPTLLRRDSGAEVPGQRVISPQTSDQMRRLMRLVVTDGTAKGADAPGFLVGGKTGTAEKPQGRRYSRKAQLSSFVGAFPMTDPKYLVIAMLDEPKGTKATFGFATGGWTAAPVVGRVIRQMGPLVGLQPVDESRPEIRHALDIELQPRGSTLASY